MLRLQAPWAKMQSEGEDVTESDDETDIANVNQKLYYVEKHSYNRNVKTRALLGTKPLECFLIFVNHEMINDLMIRQINELKKNTWTGEAFVLSIYK
ncbi:hypothetical protein Trydic_g21402 [Trypoxylus dichotomus]